MSGARRDPWAASAPAPGWRFLHGINPLAKIAGPLPALLATVLTRDLLTPSLLLLLAAGVVLVGAQATRATLATLLVGVPVGGAALTAGFALWTDPRRVADSPAVLRLGEWTLHLGAVETGAATALRLCALVALALVAGAATSGPDLVRSAVQHLRVPYRIGYAALAAYRFVPRFGHELAVIRAARRVRGRRVAGPLGAATGIVGTAVPLLAGAIRHAERVSLAMDSRAFGAHPTRTERHPVPLRRRDAAFVLLSWAVTATVFALARPFG